MDNNKIFFDPSKQKLAIEWLQSKWPNKTLVCEACGEKSWNLANFLVVSPRYENGGLNIGGRVAPQAMLTCNNCGNTKYFNAVKMGIFLNEKENPNG